MALHFLELLPENVAKLGQQMNHQQKTIHLEQQIYQSPKNITQTLLLMLMILRMSACLM